MEQAALDELGQSPYPEQNKTIEPARRRRYSKKMESAWIHRPVFNDSHFHVYGQTGMIEPIPQSPSRERNRGLLHP